MKEEKGGSGFGQWGPFQVLDERRRQQQQGYSGEQMSHRSAFVPRLAGQ